MADEADFKKPQDFSPYGTFDLEPYGVSDTKRLTVGDAEDIIFVPKINEFGFVRLVDYMGGDDAISDAATAGVGSKAVGGLTKAELFDTMHAFGHKGLAADRAFKIPQLKLHMFMPIQCAGFFVYDENGKVNEYSGRYSVMLDSAREVSSDGLEGELAIINPELTEKERKAKSRKAEGIAKAVQRQARGAYEAMLSVGFARELAREGLGIGNDTAFYESYSLGEALEAVYAARRLAELWNPDLKPFADGLESICKAVAPEATASFERKWNNELKPLGLTELRSHLDLTALQQKPDGKPRYAGQTKRLTVPAAEEVLWIPQKYLADGWFIPTDYMGSDISVVQSARVSYGAGTGRISKDDETLVRYLRRHRHSTPFEHVAIQGEQKTPIFVFPRQGGRHRTHRKEGFLGNIMIPQDEFYFVPEEELREQSKKNRQGRGVQLAEKQKSVIMANLQASAHTQDFARNILKEEGIPDHAIEALMGVGHYTRSTVVMDLHNALHYLGLRDDAHAQTEIQQNAQLWGGFLRRVAPLAYQAFLDYQKNAVSISAPEQPIFQRMVKEGKTRIPMEWYQELGWTRSKGTERNREAEELDAKLAKLFPEEKEAEKSE